MLTLKRTDATDSDFITLVSALDAEIALIDGDEHTFYAQFNGIKDIPWVIVAYNAGKAIACGAFKNYNPQTIEIKRMFTSPNMRGTGIATQILAALEQWASELGFTRSILETGKRQPEAVRLYQKNGYQSMPNFGQYKGIENSVCFEKSI